MCTLGSRYYGAREAWVCAVSGAAHTVFNVRKGFDLNVAIVIRSRAVLCALQARTCNQRRTTLDAGALRGDGSARAVGVPLHARWIDRRRTLNPTPLPTQRPTRRGADTARAVRPLRL